MLEYDKPLEIKNDEGEILYTINNLTLDAEYELDMISYKLQEVRERLLSGDRFIESTKLDVKLGKEYFKELLAAEVEGIDKSEKRKHKKRAKEVFERLEKIDKDRIKKGKKVITINDVLRATEKKFLEEIVVWLKSNVVEFEQKSLFDCALEAINISSSFIRFKTNLKKK